MTFSNNINSLVYISKLTKKMIIESSLPKACLRSMLGWYHSVLLVSMFKNMFLNIQILKRLDMYFQLTLQ